MDINKNLLAEIITYRASEIEELESHIQDNNRIWWYEERRQGKSTLVNKLREKNPSWKIIFIDMFSILNIEDFVSKYSSAIAQELFKDLTSVPDIVRECKKIFKYFYPEVSQIGNSFSINLSIEKEIDINTIVKDILNIPQKYSDMNRKEVVAIVFDDFNQTGDISVDLVSQFAYALENQEIPYIFLSSNKNKIESLFTDSKSELYNTAQRFVMKPLTESEWRLLIIQAFQKKNVQLPQKIINLIIEWSQLQAHYIFLFCLEIEKILNQQIDISNIPDLFLNNLIKREESFFKELFDSLTVNQKKSLIILARNKGESIYKAQVTDLYAINKSSLERCVQSLEQNNIIVKAQRGVLQFKNPLLRAWLISKF